ncbi:MAG: DNA polymerase III subunit delta' [Streptococcaceae bacterium]|jgi:DNA polymerase-3 subunit delta'|nr:DNA polymerase III subunit delta' [Streptococcaceae bacterium]
MANLAIDVLQPELTAHFEALMAREALSHAYLFAGGYGRYEMAIYLAQAVFCENRQGNGAPDGVCRACRLIASGEFSELHVLVPDGQTIKIEQVRELLEAFVETGFESEKKVIIISEAERLTTVAANALLKAIEEPVRETFVFLLTGNENRVLATIRSRAQLVHFPRNVTLIAEMLEKSGVQATEARFAASLADSKDEALELGESAWFSEGIKKLSRLVEIASEDLTEAYLYLSNLTELFEDKKQQEVAFEVLLMLASQAGLVKMTTKIFEAQRLWRANVNFRSALESVCL